MKVYTIQDCPFCGSDKVFIDFRNTWGVGCRGCKAFTTFPTTFKDCAGTVAAYNRRAKEAGDNGNQ